MDDDEAFVLVNRKKHKVLEVKNNPNILNYNLLESERHKSASQLLQEALQPVLYMCGGGFAHINCLNTMKNAHTKSFKRFVCFCLNGRLLRSELI